MRGRRVNGSGRPADEGSQGGYAPPTAAASLDTFLGPTLDELMAESHNDVHEQLREPLISHDPPLLPATDAVADASPLSNRWEPFLVKFNYKEGGHMPIQCISCDVGTSAADFKEAADELVREHGANELCYIGAMEVVSRVTGSNHDGKFQDEVLKGFLYAMNTMRGWIMTNGLQSSISARVGQTLWRYRHRCDAPLIGVIDMDLVSGKEQVLNEHSLYRSMASFGSTGGNLGSLPQESATTKRPSPKVSRKYSVGSITQPGSTGAKPLDCHHTHFIFLSPHGSGSGSGQSAEEAMDRSWRFAQQLESSFANQYCSSPMRRRSFDNGIREPSAVSGNAFDGARAPIPMGTWPAGSIPRVLFLVHGDKRSLDEVSNCNCNSRGSCLHDKYALPSLTVPALP